MARIGALLIYLLICPSIIYCQKYDIPYDILQAYKNQSRDFSGKPGQDYYQNSSDYNIKVHFDPEKGILKGASRITYKNNSPDSLYYIVLRLYHDIMRKGNIRDEEIAHELLTNGVQIQSLMIGDVEYINNPDFFMNRNGTNLYVSLPGLLVKGKTLNINIKWTTQLPKAHLHRFGKYGQSSWFVAYWFPQIAVYDDINGWDQLDYTGSYEFYNDFSNFDVEINVPKNYMVWATGDWKNPEDILSEKTLEKYHQVQQSDQQLNIIELKDWRNNLVFKKSGKHKFRFIAKNVTDFAFAVSESFLWTAASAAIDTLTGKRTVVHAVYPAKSKEFKNTASYGAKAIKHFSDVSLKIPYPFSKATIFNGDGGMEFPMMVNQRAEEDNSNNFVTMHELFHGYFPFYTGLNERKYAWLDEGLTSYLPMITESSLGVQYFTIEKVIRNYSGLAGDYDEPTLMTPSNQLRGFSYYHHTYWRSTLAFYVLEQYLGVEKFRKATREFVYRWQGKHPTGYDFIFTLEDVCEENLDWIINPWFFKNGWVDIGLESVELKDQVLHVEISNAKGFPVPFDLHVTLTDGSIVSKHFGVEAWKKNTKLIRVEVENISEYSEVNIGTFNLPDKNYSNNQISFHHESEKIN
jgi:hypothetical protein